MVTKRRKNARDYKHNDNPFHYLKEKKKYFQWYYEHVTCKDPAKPKHKKRSPK